MSIGSAAHIMQTGVLQVLVISAPVLIIGIAVGLIISIFQATTSIQEQTLTFVPKIAAILGSLAFFGPWMLASMKEYTQNLFMLISQMGG